MGAIIASYVLGYKDTYILENVKIISKNKESRNTRDGTVQKPTPQLFVCW